MYRVIYVSSASKLFTSSELLSFATAWQARNNRKGVTGVCLYIGGNFLQAFEGDEEVARPLFERIKSDERHRYVITLTAENCNDERGFGDWSLDFREAVDLPKPELSGI